MIRTRKSITARRPAHLPQRPTHRKRFSIASCILLILTPVCIIASILLPNFISSYQNEQMLDSPQYLRIPTDEIIDAAKAVARPSDLQGKEAVLRALQVLSGNYYQVFSEEGFRMDRTQVLDEITSALTAFYEDGFGIQPSNLKLDNLSQGLVISNDGSTMIRVWTCTFKCTDETNGHLYLQVDDASGKIVLYELDSNNVNISSLSSSAFADTDMISRWAKAWGSYLDIDLDVSSLTNDSPNGEAPTISSSETPEQEPFFELSASLLVGDTNLSLDLFLLEEVITEEEEVHTLLSMSPHFDFIEDLEKDIYSPSATVVNDLR